MSLSIYAHVGDTTTQLSDGSPFWLESAEGLGGSDVVRLNQGGPLQDGATDLGYRLQPRVLILNLLFYASDAATLDTHRSTLMATFAPLDDTALSLSVQRDDSEIRTLTCFATDDIQIDLVPEQYPAHLHRATVKMRAANPLWEANTATQGSATFSDLTQWWLAGGAISASNVKHHTEYPAQAPVNAFAGSINGDWSVVVVTAKDTAALGNDHYIWQDGTGGSASFWRTTLGTFHIHDTGLGENAMFTWPGTTDYNYHVIESRSGTQYWRYWDGTALVEYGRTIDGTATYDVSLQGGSFFSWRSRRLGGHTWTPELRKAAIYGTVTESQLNALGRYMMGTTFLGTVTLVNDGDVDGYPLITLRGPLYDAVIVNETIGGTIDLTGGTIGEGEIWSIDLRSGNKQIYDQNDSNVMGSITATPLDMANFRIAAAPAATGGTNIITMTPGSVGGSAIFSVQFTRGYLSY